MASAPAPHIEQNLMPEERLIATTRIHHAVVKIPTILFGVAVLALLLGLLLGRDGLILVTLGGLLAPILGIAALLFLIKRASTEFGLTDKRLVMKSGWLTTQVDEMPLGKVEAIRIEQDILGKFCGFGNLVTIGTGGTRRAFQTITEPFEFYARV